MARVRRFFTTLLRFGMPANLLLTLGLIVYGTFVPWPAAQQILGTYAQHIPVLVGASASRKSVGDITTTHYAREYLLLPKGPTAPSFVVFSQRNQQLIVAEESPVRLVLLPVWWILCVFGTWWFWLRPQRRASS